MTNVRVVLLIDASMETAAALSSLACDAMVKPILTRLEALHNGSDLQMAFVTYSFPSSPSGSNGYGSIACDKFRPFSESYNILRNQPLLIGLARISNVEGDSMALIDAFIQALKFCDAESPPYSSSYPTFHFIIITSHPPQITRRPPPRAQKGLDCLVWEQVPIALQQRSVNLSLIQTNSHPILPQLLSQTMDSSRFTRPWFPTGPYLVKLAGMDISDDREGRGSTTITTVQSASSPRGTKRRHVEEDGSTSMYSFSDDQNKRPRQASPSKLPPNPPTMPQGTIANSRAIGRPSAAPPPGFGALISTSHPTFFSGNPYTRSDTLGQPIGLLPTSRLPDNIGASTSQYQPLAISFSNPSSPASAIQDQWFDSFCRQSSAESAPSGGIQGPFPPEDAVAHGAPINLLDINHPASAGIHPMSVVTNNVQAWAAFRMLDHISTPINDPGSGSSITPQPGTGHPSYQLAHSLLQSPGSHHHRPIISRQPENRTASSEQNRVYSPSESHHGTHSPDYSDMSSVVQQPPDKTRDASSTPNSHLPPPADMSPVRENSLDTFLRSLTTPIVPEPSPMTNTSQLSESLSPACLVNSHESQVSSASDVNDTESEVTTGCVGSDEEFDPFKSMKILEFIMKHAADSKGKKRRNRINNVRKKNVGPVHVGVASNPGPNSPPTPPAQSTMAQQPLGSSPAPPIPITVTRPDGISSEWYGHLVFDGSLGGTLSSFEPTPVAISLSSYPLMNPQELLPETVIIRESDLRRLGDWNSFLNLLGAHNIPCPPLRHHIINGQKPSPGSGTGYDRFSNMLYENKLFASIEIPGSAAGTGIVLFPLMGVSNRKLQVALFTDPSRPLPTVDEFASYVVNMGPPMNTHALALAIPEGNTNNPHDHNVSRTAQFARAVQEEQEKQQQFLITPSPSHSSTDLNPSPESYIPPFEQNQSYDPAMYGYAGLHSSVSQPPVSDAASALPFQPAGPFDQYNVNPPSNGYDLSAANYMSETHSISPSPGYLDMQFSIHSQGIYMPPEYSQMANVDPSSYGALMENPLATQDYGYTPQSISADMYYGLESGHGQPSGTYLPNL